VWVKCLAEGFGCPGINIHNGGLKRQLLLTLTLDQLLQLSDPVFLLGDRLFLVQVRSLECNNLLL
jgi:hypothetical protein